jgi:hypothetical protein
LRGPSTVALVDTKDGIRIADIDNQ